jgi:ribosomal protein L6P/L9E
MSRIGNNPITIPEGVVVDIQSDVIIVKGTLGGMVSHMIQFHLPKKIQH